VTFFRGGHRAGGRGTGLSRDFGALIAYLVRSSPKANRVAWTSTRNLNGLGDPARVTQVMRAHASEYPRTVWPVYHCGLSVGIAEHLDRSRWEQAVDRVMEALGLVRHQALLVAHGDTDREHVHVVVNRVGDDGRTWHRGFDLVNAWKAVHRIELDFWLIRCGAGVAALPPLSDGAYLRACRSGEQPFPHRVRVQAAADFAEAAGWQDLEARLAARGFRLEPAPKHPGLTIVAGSAFTSLIRVDRSLSGPRLARRFGETFEEHRRAHPEPPAVASPPREPAPRPADSLEHRAAALLDRIAATSATFTAADLRRAAFYQPDSIALVRAALSSDRLLDLGTAAGTANRYTTRDYLDAEARFLAAAASLSSRNDHRLDLGGEDRMPAAGHEPSAAAQLPDPAAPAGPGRSAERRAAVLHAAAAPDLALIVSADDAARTATARDVAAAYRERGYDVRGTALTARAVDALQTEAGIPSGTFANLERAWSQGADHLHPRCVLVLDEAGMLDVRRLGRILAHADERHAKVVLLGDPERLQAIGAGDALRGLLEHYPCGRLDAGGRQREPWQRAASEQLAAGRIAAALDLYQDAGRLHWSGSRAAAQTELLDAYARDRRQDPGGTRLILAHDPAEVAALNAAVRAGRQAAGELGPGLRAGRAELAAGDRIVFLRDDPQGRRVREIAADAGPAVRGHDRQSSGPRALEPGARARVPAPASRQADRRDRGAGELAAGGVRYGALGTVVETDPRRVTVHLDDGRTVVFDPHRYRSVAHGYAIAVRQALEAAIDRVYVLADPRMDRHAAGLALTCHRDRLDIFVDREALPSREHLDRALSHAGHKDLAGDYAAAELRRAAARLQGLAAEANRIVLEERPLRDALAALSSLRQARQRVVESRHSLVEAAGLVYADPAGALRALLRDPQAPDRLRQGEARRYGKLRGGIAPGAPRRDRAAALHATMSLTGRLDAHRRIVAGLHAAKETARGRCHLLTIPGLRPGPRAAAARGLAAAGQHRAPAAHLPRASQVGAELARVTATLGACRQATRGAQDALETAIRTMGRATVDSALLLLPPQVALPVNVAVRAIARGLERGIDLGRGR